MNNGQKILLGLLILLGALVLFVAMQPSDFAVKRSVKIAAPAEVVFGMVNDFHRWSAWAPWGQRDPLVTRTYSGPPSGPGATCSWSGNWRAGAGTMTILESRPPEQLHIKLELTRPFAATTAVAFTFAPAADGEGTEVSWRIDGHHDLLGKAVTLFVNFDKRIGADFERGLASLKAVSETAAKRQLAPKTAAPVHRLDRLAQSS